MRKDRAPRERRRFLQIKVEVLQGPSSIRTSKIKMRQCVLDVSDVPGNPRVMKERRLTLGTEGALGHRAPWPG